MLQYDGDGGDNNDNNYVDEKYVGMGLCSLEKYCWCCLTFIHDYNDDFDDSDDEDDSKNFFSDLEDDE